MRVVPAVLAAAAFVFLSSYLGLAGRFFFVAPGDGLAFMVGIWADSIAADVVFTIGSLLAAVLTWVVAARHRGLAALVGALAHWGVYTASFLLLGETRGDAGTSGVWEAMGFVATWGFVGLAFAALAPPLAHLWMERRAAAQPASVA